MPDDIQAPAPTLVLTPYRCDFESTPTAPHLEEGLCRQLWVDASDLHENHSIDLGISEYGHHKTGPKRQELLLQEHITLPLQDAIRLAESILRLAERYAAGKEPA